MEILRVENNYSWLISNNEPIKELLWKKLRFRAKGTFYNPSYRMRLWDGHTEFFKRKTGRFLTGLLPEIKLAMKMLNLPYEIDDRRTPFEFAVQQVDDKWLGNDMTLRDYQVDYINQVIRNQRGIIPSPTSSGKTLVMVGIIKTLPPKTPTLILANRVDLVEQNYDEITKFGIPNVGRFYGKIKEPNWITCATVQSCEKLMAAMPKIRAVLIDEIHMMMSKDCKAVYNKLENANVRVGMSATWKKFGGTDKIQKFEVKGWVGPEFIAESSEDGRLTTKELQERNILSSAQCHFFRIAEPALPYEIYLDAVTKGIAENDYLHDMTAKLVSKLKGRSLIIVERIEHGDRLHDKIPGSFWVRGKDTTSTRKEIIKKLKTDANVVAIATSGIFNTGINVFVHNLINAAGGQADHEIVQRFGRGLRRASDKDNLAYYDFFFENNDYLEKHSKKRVKILEKEGHTVSVHPTSAIDDWLKDSYNPFDVL